MDVNVDIGNNTTQLIQSLATQLNMTVDKVFPYYVRMIETEAYYWLLMVGGIFLLSIIIFICAFMGGIWKVKWEDIFITIAAGAAFVFLFCILALLLFGADSLTQIAVPEPYAIKAMISDASKLIGK